MFIIYIACQYYKRVLSLEPEANPQSVPYVPICPNGIISECPHD